MGISISEIKRVAKGIRRRVLEHTIRNNGGYLSQACSSAEILSALYLRIMNLGPVESPIVPLPFSGVPGPDNPDYSTGAMFNGPQAPHLDRFFLSPSQYSLVLYATLIETGRMHPDGLEQFNRDGSTVEMIGGEHSPGMEVMSGSLGQGLSQAAGIAMARRLKGETGRVWVFMSDGEFQIGQTWEAIQTISFYKLDNIGIYVDVNGYQCDGEVSKVMNIEPIKERLESFGAGVFRVDGHNIDELIAPAKLQLDGKPIVVLCYTIPYQGIGILKEMSPKFHYIRFKDDKEKRRYKEFLRVLR
ncbi:MAG: 1-deoxy-D-xylulose-5-phosphate synthase N-terminal domain-containing protein [Nitrospirota bacterium]